MSLPLWADPRLLWQIAHTAPYEYHTPSSLARFWLWSSSTLRGGPCTAYPTRLRITPGIDTDGAAGNGNGLPLYFPASVFIRPPDMA